MGPGAASQCWNAALVLESSTAEGETTGELMKLTAEPLSRDQLTETRAAASVTPQETERCMFPSDDVGGRSVTRAKTLAGP